MFVFLFPHSHKPALLRFGVGHPSISRASRLLLEISAKRIHDSTEAAAPAKLSLKDLIKGLPERMRF
jgi:hypothetical protein